MIIENVPLVMREKPNWVGYRHEIRNDKKTKVPYCLHNQYKKASSTDKATWNTFATACKCLPLFDGVGFVFDRGLTGIDLDHCFVDGVLQDWAADIVATMESYTEVSPSGDGLHIIVEGMLPAANGTRKNGIEMYSRDRFFTVTGDVFENRLIINHREIEIARLYHKLNPMPEKAVKTEQIQLTATAVCYQMQARLDELLAANKKFYNIWHKITKHESQSHYDLQIAIEALDNGFNDVEAWWLVKENRTFHNANPKKADRADYRADTIDVAKQFINARPDLSNVVSLVAQTDNQKENTLLIDSKTILFPSEPMQWVIENYLPQTGIVWVAGQWSTYKTFIVLDMCFSIATGSHWCGNETTKSKIVYLAGEGHSGLGKRLRGLEIAREKTYDESVLMLTNSAIMLNDVVAFNKLLNVLKESHSDTRVIVVDTKSANMSGSDSDPAVMNNFINMLRVLEKQMRCLIIVVDHVGHMAKDRPRGASQQMGAADAVYMVEREPESHFVTMRVEKDPKDFDRPATLHFKAVPVELPEEWNDKHGKPQTTLVMEPSAPQDALPTVEFDIARVGLSQFKVLECLVRLYSEARERLDDPSQARIDKIFLRRECKELGMNVTNFGRWTTELEKAGLISIEGTTIIPDYPALKLLGVY